LDPAFVAQNFTPDTFKVVYAGTVNPNNPIEVLLLAVAQIPANQKIEAYILGSGSMLEYYKQKYAFSDRIKFIAPIPKKQVNAFLQHIDLCFDSIDSEIARFGLSRNKWIDYMNAGKPIICSYSGFQSMINEAQCGSFVPYGDVDLLASEITSLKELPAGKRIEMGIRAQNFLRNNRLFEKLALDYQSNF
jgi:glycosyltransferase involved in cell wall biosynthesis